MDITSIVEELYQEILQTPEEERNYWYHSYFENDLTVEERMLISNELNDKIADLNLYFSWQGVTSEYFCFYTKIKEDENTFENNEIEIENEDSNPSQPELKREWIVLHNGYGYWQYLPPEDEKK